MFSYRLDLQTTQHDRTLMATIHHNGMCTTTVLSARNSCVTIGRVVLVCPNCPCPFVIYMYIHFVIEENLQENTVPLICARIFLGCLPCPSRLPVFRARVPYPAPFHTTADRLYSTEHPAASPPHAMTRAHINTFSHMCIIIIIIAMICRPAHYRPSGVVLVRDICMVII